MVQVTSGQAGKADAQLAEQLALLAEELKPPNNTAGMHIYAF